MGLLEYVSDRVADYVNSGASLVTLARDADVPYSWLKVFARGEIPNPGVQQIERLAAHFGPPPARRRARASEPAAH